MNEASLDGFVDELIKIAASPSKSTKEEPKRSIGPAIRAAIVGAAGGAAGYGAVELAARRLKMLSQPNADGLRAAKIILPILSGSAVMIADRYRQKMNDEYSKVKGFQATSKK